MGSFILAGPLALIVAASVALYKRRQRRQHGAPPDRNGSRPPER